MLRSVAIAFGCLLALTITASPLCRAQEKNGPSKPKDESATPAAKSDDWRGNLEALTKLRREQKKRDPITVEVVIPKDLHATTRELPVFDVALKNVDEDKAAVTMMKGGDYRSGRLARWQFEVHDSKGNLLPKGHWDAMMGGGIVTTGQLAFGEEWKVKLPMENYVQIKVPGQYTVRILYHGTESIADKDQSELQNLVLCSSKEFKMTVGRPVPKVVEVPAGSRERAKALVSALSDEGPIRLICGDYVESLNSFMDPKSPEGQLTKMGKDAIPGLLDALRDEKLSFHRRGWVLGLLYYFTGERDLNPFAWRSDMDGLTPAYEVRGIGCSATGGGGDPNPAGQRKFTQEWLKLAAECWDFRESKK